MSKLKIFLILGLACMAWAVPYNVEVVKTGDGDEIRAGQLIKVHYKGFLYADVAADTVKLDSAVKAAPKDTSVADSASEEPTATGPVPFADTYASGEPLEFEINAVIPGWTEVLKLMKVGSKVVAWIPPDLGYGEKGRPPKIPGNSVLVFEMELLDAQNP